MSNNSEIFKLYYYLELIIKRQWLIFIPFCMSMIAGIYLVFALPKIYRAETLILIQPQKVPANYVQPIVSSDIESRISTISQQIMSRTNIEKIINEFNIFSKQQNEGLFLEDKIEIVRKRISVQVTRAARAREGAEAFSISFEGEKPVVVMNVANALATFFIDENLKEREAQAVGTSDFLDNERKSRLKLLEAGEKKLKDYRTRYMGELPEQLDSNLRLLDRLEDQLNQRLMQLRDTKNRLIQAEAQILEPTASVTYRVAQSRTPIRPDSNDVTNLNNLKAQLTEFLTKYTDLHPDVIRLKKLIAELETKIEQKQEEPVSQPDQSVSQPGAIPAEETAQRRQLDVIKIEIKGLESEISNIRRKIKVYQNRVEATPKREQELMSLKRDYDNILSSYNSLLNRKLEAEISVNMEKRQKGEQFRVIDPAKLPQKPISPKMQRIFIMLVATGLGIGCGLILILDFTDTSFKSDEDIKTLIELPVIASIPLIVYPKAKRWQIFYRILNFIQIIISIGLLAGFAALSFKGIEWTKAFIGKLINIIG